MGAIGYGVTGCKATAIMAVGSETFPGTCKAAHLFAVCGLFNYVSSICCHSLRL